MNAHVAIARFPKPEAVTNEDGGVYVSRDTLEKLGGGAAAQGRRDLRLFLASYTQAPAAPPTGVPKKPANVRFAKEGDEPALLELLRVDIQENAEAVAPMDDEKVLQVIQVGTRFRNGFVGVIDGPAGHPVALIVLHPIQWWWSQAWYFGEVVKFVHPDHRRSHYNDDLDAFGRWISDQQTRRFGYRVYYLCGVLGTRRLRAKMLSYGRKFCQVGAAYLYPPPPGGVT
jgi:hypothetical protein